MGLARGGKGKLFFRFNNAERIIRANAFCDSPLSDYYNVISYFAQSSDIFIDRFCSKTMDIFISIYTILSEFFHCGFLIFLCCR